MDQIKHSVILLYDSCIYIYMFYMRADILYVINVVGFFLNYHLPHMEKKKQTQRQSNIQTLCNFYLGIELYKIYKMS